MGGVSEPPCCAVSGKRANRDDSPTFVVLDGLMSAEFESEGDHPDGGPGGFPVHRSLFAVWGLAFGVRSSGFTFQRRSCQCEEAKRGRFAYLNFDWDIVFEKPNESQEIRRAHISVSAVQRPPELSRH
jgi:hypothetical protein